MGTPSYMAPEQAEGKRDVGPAADIYALGAVLYELITGRPPFRAPTPLGTLAQVVDNEPVPPRQLQPKLPRDLETICLKCIEKKTGKRYPTAEGLASDLHHYLNNEPIEAQAAGLMERFQLWCGRPQRVPEAGVALIFFSVVLLVWSALYHTIDSLSHLAGDWTNRQEWIRSLYVVALCAVFQLPMLAVGWGDDAAKTTCIACGDRPRGRRRVLLGRRTGRLLLRSLWRFPQHRERSLTLLVVRCPVLLVVGGLPDCIDGLFQQSRRHAGAGDKLESVPQVSFGALAGLALEAEPLAPTAFCQGAAAEACGGRPPAAPPFRRTQAGARSPSTAAGTSPATRTSAPPPTAPARARTPSLRPAGSPLPPGTAPDVQTPSPARLPRRFDRRRAVG